MGWGGANQDHRTRDAQSHQVREPVTVEICSIGRSRKLKSMGLNYIGQEDLLNFQVCSYYWAEVGGASGGGGGGGLAILKGRL